MGKNPFGVAGKKTAGSDDKQKQSPGNAKSFKGNGPFGGGKRPARKPKK